ncbi:MAG: hemerythrin domain-containing protein [Bacteroidales bacterium]|nr:hemerythrin domain-containing protein [Bacteroidales bacterium]
MENLIEKLKDDHKELNQLFANVYEYLVSDEKKSEFVNKFKTAVLRHIESEDTYLYPFLNKEAETNSALKTKLDFFAKDWQVTSDFAIYYIEKYSEGRFDDSFAGDTAKLLSNLRQRMMTEEISLYSEYERRENLLAK